MSLLYVNEDPLSGIRTDRKYKTVTLELGTNFKPILTVVNVSSADIAEFYFGQLHRALQQGLIEPSMKVDQLSQCHYGGEV